MSNYKKCYEGEKDILSYSQRVGKGGNQ